MSTICHRLSSRPFLMALLLAGLLMSLPLGAYACCQIIYSGNAWAFFASLKAGPVALNYSGYRQ